ncbi:MAG: HAD hydrolase family protein, partial [Lachnospiraceae bacterium]|nr:HAD hydrolase family protein [Lachnospiraceae bacterium]
GERMDTTKVVKNFQELNNTGVPVYKLFLFSDDREMLAEIDKELAKQKQIAVSSSFPTNLEITDVRAQKGPVLKEYIESLGYQMEEVMTFGDSRNDESMLSMDFGATIAMANADEELKKVAKYITKSNVELGVAYVIEELLKQF